MKNFDGRHRHTNLSYALTLTPLVQKYMYTQQEDNSEHCTTMLDSAVRSGTGLACIIFPTECFIAISLSHTDGNAIFHLSSESELNLTSHLSKSVALCYRKYGDSNLIIYTHRTSWMISSYSTPPLPPPFPAATLKVPSCSFVARLSFQPSMHLPASSHPSYM